MSRRKRRGRHTPEDVGNTAHENWDETAAVKNALGPMLTDGHVTVMNAAHYHALREALYKNTFHQAEGTPWPTAELEKGNARGQAQLRPAAADAQPLLPPEEMEVWAKAMWRQRGELSDLDADALDALSALWLYQARSAQDDATADLDGLLAMRGIKPKQAGNGRRGGYEPEQRADMLRALSHVQNLWLNMAEIEVYEEPANGKGRRRTVKETIQSRPFVITDRMGQIRLDGNMEVRKFIFRPGKVFAHFLMGPGQQTALLSAKALKYDPYRQKWEKRLARYLSWQWRAKARNADYLRPYRIGTLIEAVGDEGEGRAPSRTRDRLEKCLDTLKEDGVLAAWQYDRWDEEAASQRGWLQEWLQATVLIEPPDAVKEQYRPIERRSNSPTLPSPTNKAVQSPMEAGPLREWIKAHRKVRKLSQMQAAEELGISQAYLSNIERGKVLEGHLSVELRGKVTKWLADDYNSAD